MHELLTKQSMAKQPTSAAINKFVASKPINAHLDKHTVGRFVLECTTWWRVAGCGRAGYNACDGRLSEWPSGTTTTTTRKRKRKRKQQQNNSSSTTCYRRHCFLMPWDFPAFFTPMACIVLCASLLLCFSPSSPPHHRLVIIIVIVASPRFSAMPSGDPVATSIQLTESDYELTVEQFIRRSWEQRIQQFDEHTAAMAHNNSNNNALTDHTTM
jgi:hypothetical protein